LIFLTFAAAIAYRRGAKHIVTGVCETDYSGYPDCRDDTIKALQVALNLGTEMRFVIDTPLMWIDKAATWALAKDLGGEALVDLIVEYSHTCYQGDREHRHAWGYGCGSCPACDLRASGFAAQMRKSRRFTGVTAVQPASVGKATSNSANQPSALDVTTTSATMRSS
jgi:7-cyano-7-deazaguanine synthase